jgi:hypothetical protein
LNESGVYGGAYTGFIGHTNEWFIIAEAQKSMLAMSMLPDDAFNAPASHRSTQMALERCGYDLTIDVARRLSALSETDLHFQLQPSSIFAPGWTRATPINQTRLIEMQEQARLVEAGGFKGFALFLKGEALLYQAEINMTNALRAADATRSCGGTCFVSKGPAAGAPDWPAATIIKINLPINPSSHKGGLLITAARAMLKDLEASNRCQTEGLNMTFYLGDVEGTIINHDMMHLTLGEFKRTLPITIGLVFVMIGFCLKSAAVPLRLGMTLFLPLASIFGIAVTVYQWGYLNSLGIGNVAPSPDGSFHWEVPIFSFAMSIALALDYDLFVVTRIADYRFAGYSIQASIIRALYETGPVVTGAGLMMALSFGGNLLAESSCLNEGGWLLASGVLIDTFVVRTLLVPALFSFSDAAVWWPSKPPQQNLLNEFDTPYSLVVVLPTEGESEFDTPGADYESLTFNRELAGSIEGNLGV